MVSININAQIVCTQSHVSNTQSTHWIQETCGTHCCIGEKPTGAAPVPPSRTLARPGFEQSASHRRARRGQSVGCPRDTPTKRRRLPQPPFVHKRKQERKGFPFEPGTRNPQTLRLKWPGCGGLGPKLVPCGHSCHCTIPARMTSSSVTHSPPQ